MQTIELEDAVELIFTTASTDEIETKTIIRGVLCQYADSEKQRFIKSCTDY